MRNRALPLSLVSTALFLISCDRPAIEPSQSLVGAKELPSSTTLSREIIYISRGFGWDSHDLLSYELRPDDVLTVTYDHTDRDTLKKISRKDIFHLSSNVTQRTRRMLWRVRPEQLKGIEWETKPVGCRSDRTDDFPEISVGFVAEGPKPGIEDDRLGLFVLPYPSSCSTRSAVEVRSLMHQVLQSLPPSRVAVQFDQEVKRRWEQANS
jgi:hypothetical protein